MAMAAHRASAAEDSLRVGERGGTGDWTQHQPVFDPDPDRRSEP